MEIILEEENLESIVGKIRSAINLKFTREDVIGLQRRRQLLRELFGKIPPKSAAQFQARLGDQTSQDELSQLFHGRLATPTRNEMLTILSERAEIVVENDSTPIPEIPVVFPDRPLPSSFSAQLETALTDLEAKINEGTDPRKDRFLCWINKLRDPSTDDRMIEWETICARESNAAAPFSTSCELRGFFTSEQDLFKHIKQTKDVELANSKLKFMTHLKSHIVFTNQFSSLQLESFRIIHDDIIKTVHVLENMVINHPISGSAIPDYYSAIRKWIKDQQTNPRSLYSCM